MMKIINIFTFLMVIGFAVANAHSIEIQASADDIETGKIKIVIDNVITDSVTIYAKNQNVFYYIVVRTNEEDKEYFQIMTNTSGTSLHIESPYISEGCVIEIIDEKGILYYVNQL